MRIIAFPNQQKFQRLPFEVVGAFSFREQLTAACNQATTPVKNSRKHLVFDPPRS
jgi:hypothetical protein